jgi:hypothetical protein
MLAFMYIKAASAKSDTLTSYLLIRAERTLLQQLRILCLCPAVSCRLLQELQRRRVLRPDSAIFALLLEAYRVVAPELQQ